MESAAIDLRTSQSWFGSGTACEWHSFWEDRTSYSAVNLCDFAINFAATCADTGRTA
ncbi:hypothetical protein [Pectobacterium versatile]|uniref:hypothetical protein n=1 Tax=Pectobacterium versatile TaxID=2488639 RepID=UPI001CCB8146|nr:hypothetical protein [Pectobacterium versatile]